MHLCTNPVISCLKWFLIPSKLTYVWLLMLFISIFSFSVFQHIIELMNWSGFDSPYEMHSIYRASEVHSTHIPFGIRVKYHSIIGYTAYEMLLTYRAYEVLVTMERCFMEHPSLFASSLFLFISLLVPSFSFWLFSSTCMTPILYRLLFSPSMIPILFRLLFLSCMTPILFRLLFILHDTPSLRPPGLCMEWFSSHLTRFLLLSLFLSARAQWNLRL